MTTEAARDELRFAVKYLERYDNRKPSFRDVSQDDLDLAFKYIEKARALDPHVTLMQKLPDKKVGMVTPDLMEAFVLKRQANFLAGKFDRTTLKRDPHDLYTARIKLERALALRPTYSSLYIDLAYVYHHEMDEKRAIGLLKDAETKFPGDFDIRAALDHISANPVPPDPFNFRRFVIQVGLLTIVIGFTFQFMSGYVIPEQNPLTFVAIFGPFVGIFLLVIGFKMEKP
jgi:hypothetical protein